MIAPHRPVCWPTAPPSIIAPLIPRPIFPGRLIAMPLLFALITRLLSFKWRLMPPFFCHGSNRCSAPPMSKLTGGVIAHCITAFFVCPKSQKGFTQRNCQNASLVHSDSCGFRSSQLAINRIHKNGDLSKNDPKSIGIGWFSSAAHQSPRKSAPLTTKPLKT